MPSMKLQTTPVARPSFSIVATLIALSTLSTTAAWGQAVSPPRSVTPGKAGAPATTEPVKEQAAAGKLGVSLSLARIIAPMFQLKGDYIVSKKLAVGVVAATGSPARPGLSSYSQHELGVWGGYFPLGTVRKGIGVVGQLRGYLSSGAQNGDDGSEMFTASGHAFSAGGFIVARLQTKNRLLLQADAGLTWLRTAGSATGKGETTEATATSLGRLVNLWVGLVF